MRVRLLQVAGERDHGAAVMYLAASEFPALTWYGAGGYRGSEQVKHRPSAVFG